VTFDRDEMFFLQSDTLVLPILNATIEELSYLLLEQFLANCAGDDLREVELFVASGAGQRASASWKV